MDASAEALVPPQLDLSDAGMEGPGAPASAASHFGGGLSSTANRQQHQHHADGGGGRPLSVSHHSVSVASSARHPSSSRAGVGSSRHTAVTTHHQTPVAGGFAEAFAASLQATPRFAALHAASPRGFAFDVDDAATAGFVLDLDLIGGAGYDFPRGDLEDSIRRDGDDLVAMLSERDTPNSARRATAAKSTTTVRKNVLFARASYALQHQQQQRQLTTHGSSFTTTSAGLTPHTTDGANTTTRSTTEGGTTAGEQSLVNSSDQQQHPRSPAAAAAAAAGGGSSRVATGTAAATVGSSVSHLNLFQDFTAPHGIVPRGEESYHASPVPTPGAGAMPPAGSAAFPSPPQAAGASASAVDCATAESGSVGASGGGLETDNGFAASGSLCLTTQTGDDRHGSVVAAGASGSVRLAFSKTLNATVAVKTIRETTDDKQITAKNELAFAQRLIERPFVPLRNVIEIIDVSRCTETFETVVVMELAPFGTVADMPELRPLRRSSGSASPAVPDRGTASRAGTVRHDTVDGNAVEVPALGLGARGASTPVSRRSSVATGAGSPASDTRRDPPTSLPSHHAHPATAAQHASSGLVTPGRFAPVVSLLPPVCDVEESPSFNGLSTTSTTLHLTPMAATSTDAVDPAPKSPQPQLRSVDSTLCPLPPSHEEPGSSLPTSRGDAAQPSSGTATSSGPRHLSTLTVPETALRRVAVGALRGLRTLHDGLRVLHRDVTPRNLLVAADGAVKLADFGVVAVLPTDGGADAAATDQAGSIAYMAPERLRGEPHGPASDVWSVGVVLLELALGGRHPFLPADAGDRFWALTSALRATEGAAACGAATAELVEGALGAVPSGLSGGGFGLLVRRLLRAEASERPTAARVLAEDTWLTAA